MIMLTTIGLYKTETIPTTVRLYKFMTVLATTKPHKTMTIQFTIRPHQPSSMQTHACISNHPTGQCKPVLIPTTIRPKVAQTGPAHDQRWAWDAGRASPPDPRFLSTLPSSSLWLRSVQRSTGTDAENINKEKQGGKLCL